MTREYSLQAVVDALQVASVTADRLLLETTALRLEATALRETLASVVAALRADAAARRAEKGGA